MAEEPMSNNLLVSTDPRAACLFIVGANKNSDGTSASELVDASSSRSMTIEVLVNGVKRVITVPFTTPEEVVVTPMATSESCVRPPDVQPTISQAPSSVQDSKMHLRSTLQTMTMTSNSAVFTGDAVSQQMPSYLSSLISGPQQTLNNSTAVKPLNTYTQYQAPFTNVSKDARYHNNNLLVTPLTMQQDVRSTHIFSNRPVILPAALPPNSNAYLMYGNNPQQTFTNQPWNGNVCQLASIQPLKTVLPQAVMASNASFAQPNFSFNRMPQSLPVHGNQGGFAIQYRPLRSPSKSTVGVMQWPSCVQQTSGSIPSHNNNQVGIDKKRVGALLHGVSNTRYLGNSVQPRFVSNVVSSKAVEDFARTYAHLCRAVNPGTGGNTLGNTDFQPDKLNLPVTSNFNSVVQQLQLAAAPGSSVRGKTVQFSDAGQLLHVESFQSLQVHRADQSQKLNNIRNPPALDVNTQQSGMLYPRHRAVLQNQLNNSTSSHSLNNEHDQYSQFRIASTRSSTQPSDTVGRATYSAVTLLSSISAAVANSKVGVRNISATAQPSVSTHSMLANLPDVGGRGDSFTTANCVVTNASTTFDGDNSNDLIDNLLPDVMDSAESDYLLTAFTDMLEQQLPENDSTAKGSGVERPTGKLANTPMVEQSGDSLILGLHSCEEIRNALQIAKSIGKGMHHVEEEKNNRHMLQKQRVRQHRRKQQLTNLEYDDTCTNSSDSWHPDEFESHSTDVSPLSFIVSDSASSDSWTSNDSVTIGRKRRCRKTAMSETRHRASRKSSARRTTRQREEQKPILAIQTPNTDQISYSCFDIKPCSVKLEVIKMFGRRTVNVTEAEKYLCCERRKVIWRAKRIIDSDDETDINSVSSDCFIKRARSKRTKMPRISDSDSS